jgi:hypothetical protein
MMYYIHTKPVTDHKMLTVLDMLIEKTAKPMEAVLCEPTKGRKANHYLWGRVNKVDFDAILNTLSVTAVSESAFTKATDKFCVFVCGKDRKTTTSNHRTIAIFREEEEGNSVR